MSNEPKLTVSGYRGIWEESLTEDIVINYTKAFIQFVKENINKNPIILLGRDGRESGPKIKKIIIETLKSLGIDFIDGDILPTPTVLYAVSKYKYDGAIIITASHNPREYNGLKFVNNKALFTDEKEVEIIKNNFENIINKLPKKFHQNILKEKKLLKSLAPAGGPSRANFQQKIMCAFKKYFFWKNKKNFPKEHADKILENINIDLIKSKKWRVAVDMINASASVLDPYLFEKLGVELVPLNDIPDGKFTHKPEPIRENLEDIAKIVIEKNCHLGFAHDPDADRLVIIDEKGKVISEEYTLAFGIEAILAKPKNYAQNIIINMSSSNMSEDITQKYDGKCLRTKVGEANVVAGIIENNAVIGGEGGGGIIYPTINMARDSFVSLALILELLSERNQTVSVCVDSLPKYEMKKDKVPIVGNLEKMYQKMKNHYKDCEVNELDGLRLNFPDRSWIHLRLSNTEPIIRLIGEAKNKEQIEKLFEETKKVIL